MFAIVLLGIVAPLISLAPADAETKKLKLYYLHTGEKATIAYKKNGKYIPAGLKRINTFLRDWRRNEPTRMDPELLDLVWEIYKKSGSSDYIHVVSGYRSPATNNMLRKRGRGVAKRSQHTLGKALDFFLPDVKLAKIRNIGLIKQNGGVGYYPRSGSPFIHIDTGSVRHWPRMSRKELVRVFPNGKTLHIPTDGKPLAGYNQAVASYNAKKSGVRKVAVAKGDDKERKSFFARLASLGTDEEEDQNYNYAARKKAKFARKTVAKSPPKYPKKIPSAQAKIIDEIPEVNSDLPPDLPPDMPPDLPLMASIPVPLVAPRRRPQVLEPFNRISTASSFNVARLDGDTNRNQQAFRAPANIPVQAFQPTFAANQSNSSDPDRVIVQSDRFGAIPSANENLQLASINTQHLRERLIAQANKQLYSWISPPPRPLAPLGSRFSAAFVAPQDNLQAQPQSLMLAALSSPSTQPLISRNLAPPLSPPVAIPLRRPHFASGKNNYRLQNAPKQATGSISQIILKTAPTPILAVASSNRKLSPADLSTIQAEGKLRAPAYARDVIRPSPSAILTARFVPSAGIQNSTNFTPNSIYNLTFTRLN